MWDSGGRKADGDKADGDKADGISFVELFSIILQPLLLSGSFFFIAQHFGNWLVVVLLHGSNAATIGCVAADMQHLRCPISVHVQQSYLPFLPNRHADLKL